MPAWAHGEREVITVRLKAAGCLIFEEAEMSSVLLSPDGTIRVEREKLQEERSALHESIRVVALPDGAVLAHLLNYGGAEPTRFPQPGMAVIELTDRLSQRCRIEIDAAARTVRTLPKAEGASLVRPPEQMGYGSAASPLRLVLGRLLDGFLALAGVLLTVGSVWMALAGQMARDRWIGLLGAVFFGACGASALRDLLRRRPKAGR